MRGLARCGRLAGPAERLCFMQMLRQHPCAPEGQRGDLLDRQRFRRNILLDTRRERRRDVRERPRRRTRGPVHGLGPHPVETLRERRPGVAPVRSAFLVRISDA